MTQTYDDREEGRRHSLGRGRSNRAGTGPASFAIIRAKKLGTGGQIAASASHTFRERETHNADPERTSTNQILVGPESAKGITQAWADRAPDKVRANAVRAVEYLVTASPEAMQRMSREEQDAYFRDAVKFLQDKHGPENVLSAVVHRDETTPHLTAMVIPLDERGKLNARQFLGGRDKLRELQTDFAERVGKDHGLERGIEKSGARHRTIRSFYAEIEGAQRKAVKAMPPPPRYLVDKSAIGKLMRAKEPVEDYEKRVHTEWKDQVAPLVAKAQRADELADKLEAVHREQVRAQPEQEKTLRKSKVLDLVISDPKVGPVVTEFLNQRLEEQRQQERKRELERVRERTLEIQRERDLKRERDRDRGPRGR